MRLSIYNSFRQILKNINLTSKLTFNIYDARMLQISSDIHLESESLHAHTVPEPDKRGVDELEYRQEGQHIDGDGPHNLDGVSCPCRRRLYDISFLSKYNIYKIDLILIPDLKRCRMVHQAERKSIFNATLVDVTTSES